ncbi:MAG: hypothetical protein NWE93_02980 [Candidatus Bathyarchaeota archaeon]|nr:hypothetical protein [Candidatus Bathyarchaeota archaeon]
MAKNLSLPLRVYEDLNRVSEELTLMAKKPVSAAMAVDLLIEIYRAHLSNPCALDLFSQQLHSANLMAPKEFDRYWDENISQEPRRHNTKTKGK